MSSFTIISILLLLIVAIDAAGDAFRIHQWQNVHHAMEVIVSVLWFIFAALFAIHVRHELIFNPGVWSVIKLLLPFGGMYITGRIWLFDPLLNLIAGYRLTYSGKSSVYGRVLSWFQGKVKEPGHLVWVLRVMALVAWIVWILTIR